MRTLIPTTSWTADRLRACMRDGATYLGPLDELTHDDFIDLLEREGGMYVPFTVRRAREAGLVVIGSGAVPLTPTGEPFDFDRRCLIAERELLDLLGHPHEGTADDRRFSLDALAELLTVPHRRLEAWLKAGLLKPAAVRGGVARFDFAAAALARTLVNLTDAGVTVNRLRRSLQRVSAWLPRAPHSPDPLAMLTTLERNGPLLLRLESGDLAEVCGQLQIDFDEPRHPHAGPAPVQFRIAPDDGPADWHERGVEQEQGGHLEDAVDSYRKALLMGGPDAQIAFDLAGALAGLGLREAAMERFAQVVEIEPARSDAWNNLGVLLAEHGDLDAAADAFRTVIRHDPDDVDAIYNLADTLEDAGLHRQALPHWRAIVQKMPSPSPWTDRARAALARQVAD